ncbi:MAG: methyltransferase domain-containing protein, partial [Opitutales bacterium]
MEGINRELPAIRKGIRARSAAFKKGATILIREAEGGVTTDHKAVIEEKVGALSLRFLAGDFFQNNPFILERITDYVRDEALGGGNRFLVDAYCGSGLFCLRAADAFEAAAGIEINESSVQWAVENARRNATENCSFEVGDAASIFAGISFPAGETAVIIDPPRKGSDEAFLQQLFAFRPQRVVYVSCNPATQIRDLGAFSENGYGIDKVQPFDLFPQTKHLECVVTLTDGSRAETK